LIPRVLKLDNLVHRNNLLEYVNWYN